MIMKMKKIVNIDALATTKNIIENLRLSNNCEVLIQLLFLVDKAIKYKTRLFFYF